MRSIYVPSALSWYGLSVNQFLQLFCSVNDLLKIFDLQFFNQQKDLPEPKQKNIFNIERDQFLYISNVYYSLSFLNLKSITLLTNSPEFVEALSSYYIPNLSEATTTIAELEEFDYGQSQSLINSLKSVLTAPSFQMQGSLKKFVSLDECQRSINIMLCAVKRPCFSLSKKSKNFFVFIHFSFHFTLF